MCRYARYSPYGLAATLIPLGILEPATASACSVCVDAALSERIWWSPGILFFVWALAFEMIVVGVGLRIAKIPVAGGAWWLLGGIVLSVLLIGAGIGGRLGMGLGLGLCLLIRLGRSLRTMAPTHPRIAVARAGVVAAIVIAGVISVRPSTQTTESLARRVGGWLRHAPVPAHLAPTSWVEHELLARPDGPAFLMARLESFGDVESRSHRDRARILRLLRAHAMADAPAAERHLACRQLGVAPDWGELVSGLNAGRVCGFEMRNLAAGDPTNS